MRITLRRLNDTPRVSSDAREEGKYRTPHRGMLRGGARRDVRDSPRRAWFPRVTAARPALVIFRGAYIASSTGPQLRLIDQKVRRTYQVQPGDSRAAELLNW
jgi:hypothetical protein